MLENTLSSLQFKLKILLLCRYCKTDKKHLEIIKKYLDSILGKKIPEIIL